MYSNPPSAVEIIACPANSSAEPRRTILERRVRWVD